MSLQLFILEDKYTRETVPPSFPCLPPPQFPIWIQKKYHLFNDQLKNYLYLQGSILESNYLTKQMYNVYFPSKHNKYLCQKSVFLVLILAIFPKIIVQKIMSLQLAYLVLKTLDNCDSDFKVPETIWRHSKD